jgi:hypothetical protein
LDSSLRERSRAYFAFLLKKFLPLCVWDMFRDAGAGGGGVGWL